MDPETLHFVGVLSFFLRDVEKMAVSKNTYLEAFGTQKRLSKDVALEKWKQLLPSAPFPESSKPLIESWFEFVSTDGSESISADLWKCLWDFFMTPNLIGEDAESHW